jgi:hypothetical protein
MPIISDQEVLIIDSVGGTTYQGKVEVGDIELTNIKDEPERKVSLHVYTTLGSVRKNIVTPVDMFAYCDPKPYIYTPTGSLRFFLLALLGVMGGYSIVLGMVLSYWVSGLQYGIPQVSSQFTVNLIEVVVAIGVPVFSYFYVQLKHHYVSYWEVEPYENPTEYQTTDFYIPVNTTKHRTTELVKTIENIESDSAKELIEAIHKYQSELIDEAQNDAEQYKENLELTQIKNRNRKLDLDTKPPLASNMTTGKLVALVASVVAISVLITLFVQ